MAKNFLDKYISSLKSEEKTQRHQENQGSLSSGTKTCSFIYDENGKRKQLNFAIK
ncbi:MAG: hypothetical protein WCL71_01500 [Deltaproteobacteria bacterium]